MCSLSGPETTRVTSEEPADRRAGYVKGAVGWKQIKRGGKGAFHAEEEAAEMHHPVWPDVAPTLAALVVVL